MKKLELQTKLAKTQYISQYVTDLRQITGYYLPWIPEATNDAEHFYDLMENEMEVARCLNVLALMAAGEYFEIETKDKLFGKIITRGLSSIKRFIHARKSMVQKMILYGLTVHRKKWKKVKWAEYGDMVWDVPIALVEIDRRRMRIERDVYKTGSIKKYSDPHWTIWDPEHDQYVILEDKRVNPLAKHYTQQFMWIRYENEETSPYGRGLGEVMYQLAYIKNKVIQTWADLSEKWGQPLMIASIDAAKAAVDAATYAASGSIDAQTQVLNWIDMMEGIRARNVGVKDADDKIEVHQAGQTGQNILQQLVQYIDSKIELLLLGASLTTSTQGYGSYGQSQTHKGITGAIIQYNQELIQEEIEKDLIYEFYIRNRKNFLALGIKWPGFPGVKFKIKMKVEDQQEEMMDKMNPNSKMFKQLGM